MFHQFNAFSVITVMHTWEKGTNETATKFLTGLVLLVTHQILTCQEDEITLLKTHRSMFFPIYNKESAVQGFIFLCILKAHLYMDEHALFINRRDLLLPFIHMQTFRHVICMQNGHITTTTCYKFFMFSVYVQGTLNPGLYIYVLFLCQWLRS
jgi:hypothetical protein